MRKAMADAEVGDDVFGDDPTVNRLEAELADRLGKAAAMFVSSGTQSNLAAMLSHCERGDEYLVGSTYHCYRYEAGGAAVLGSIQPQPLEVLPDGRVSLAAVKAAVKPDDSHFARSRLLCLENTTDGRVLGVDYLCEVAAVARERGLSVHLDGARLFNAAVALGVDASTVAASADTVSVCLSKGLGAPVGSVLCGSMELIGRARRWRKMLGGGLRQAGVLAAAGRYALEHHVERLAQDHERACALAEGLIATGRFTLAHEPGERTNMVFAQLIDPAEAAGLNRQLADAGILVLGGPDYRFVTHLDLTDDDIEAFLAVASKG